MPLSTIQFLVFEVGHECNLSHAHSRCPNGLGLARYGRLDVSRELDDAAIVACAGAAYQRFGFQGMIAWHYYNEPTLQWERLRELMRRIHLSASTSSRNERPWRPRFCLWTNGTRGRENKDFLGVNLLVVTDYPGGVQLDDRLAENGSPGAESDMPCVRPFCELVIDNFGNHHPCCADRRGEASLGNIFQLRSDGASAVAGVEEGFAAIVRRWEAFRQNVCGGRMTPQAPPRCRRCRSIFRDPRDAAILSIVPAAAAAAKIFRRGDAERVKAGLTPTAAKITPSPE